MEGKLWKSEVDETGSGLSPMAAFDVSGVETLYSANTMFINWLINQKQTLTLSGD